MPLFSIEPTRPMNVSTLCLLLGCLLCNCSDSVHASICFDFSKKVVPSFPNPVDRLGSGDVTRSGDLPTKGVWGAARGAVAKPIKDVLKRLLDPSVVKNPETQKLEIENVNKPHFYAFRRVNVKINPFLFFTASWTEEWAYSIEEGSPESPKSVLILYQKVDGTSHIEHLCGSIVLRVINNEATDVLLYEEIKATRRSAEDTAKGHLGTLTALRK